MREICYVNQSGTELANKNVYLTGCVACVRISGVMLYVLLYKAPVASGYSNYLVASGVNIYICFLHQQLQKSRSFNTKTILPHQNWGERLEYDDKQKKKN